MVTIKKFVFNPFSENTYVVFDENNTAVIIDPGMYYSAEEKIIDDFLSENDLELKAIIHTHSHLDHMFGTAYLAEKYQLSPYLFEKDFETYKLNKKFVIERIVNYMENYKDFVGHVQKQRLRLKERYFSGKALYNSISR